MAQSNATLDTLIVKATNPLVEQPDPLDIASFCEKVEHEFDGPQIAVKLLAYRIHSPQEKEALNALALLEQCVKSCGPAFHSEIGKFRFLNELIKLVSPKYQAHRTPIQIKQRILDIMYTWTIDLKSEPKILEAYNMLKQQGVIKETPKYLGTSDTKPASPSAVPPRQRAPIFDDAEKEALLQRLLKSKNPEDLQAANRLIKSMVREEENRVEAACRRQLELETVTSNIRLLQELLDNCENNGATAEDMELCKELAANCDRLRPNLSKLATETDDKGDALADILQTSDELTQVLDKYEELSRTFQPPAPTTQPRSAALDLLDLGPVLQPSLSPRSAMDDPLLSFGLDEPGPASPAVNLLQPLKAESTVNGSLARTPDVRAVHEDVHTKPRGLEDLDILGEALMKQSLPVNAKTLSGFQKPPEKVPLNMMAKKKADEMAQANKEAQSHSSLLAAATGPQEEQPPTNPKNPTGSYIPMDFDLLMQTTSPAATTATVQPAEPALSITVDPKHPVENDVSMLGHGGTSISEGSGIGHNDDVQMLHSPPLSGGALVSPSSASAAPALADISLKIDDIKPSSKCPVPLLVQESGLSVKLLSASAQVPKNVSVFVVTVTSCHSSPLTNFTFQAIVPKGNRVKLLPPSDNKLPAFNPFLPPPAITQIMLLSTAGLNLIELKFVVSFDMDGETITEMGSIKELALHC